MSFFTFLYGGKRFPLHILALFLCLIAPLSAQTDTNGSLPGPGQMSLDAALPTTNSVPASLTPASSESTIPPEAIPLGAPAVQPGAMPAPIEMPAPSISEGSILAAFLTFASLIGFLLYQGGLVRAKNSGHTATLLLVGALFALTGYWIGGFAVQTGGLGDSHAALSLPLQSPEKSALDHELGFLAFGHYWGLMGSAGFFLAIEDSARKGIAALFLVQAALLTVAIAAALGAALERGRLLAMAIFSFLVGVIVYPLLANWVWGGGWLAALGREFGLGHGFVDPCGGAVVHQTAGVLALVLATVLGPRHGRFGRNHVSRPVPGHHVPFFLLGSAILLLSWTATNAFACSGLTSGTAGDRGEAGGGVAALNTLLAAAGGLIAAFVLAGWKQHRFDPAQLCRGLLGGAVAACGCGALIDPWAAFFVGVVASLLVRTTMTYMEKARIDDPVGATAVHGVAGAWGILALGFFANGTSGDNLNGVAGPVRGLFFGGAWHQLAAQIIGGVAGFAVVCLLGYAGASLVQKILGARADLASETQGLDFPELGAFGYQADAEPEE